MPFETSIGNAEVAVRIDYHEKVRPLYKRERAHLRLHAELQALEEGLMGK